jgi:hypothetical protein
VAVGTKVYQGDFLSGNELRLMKKMIALESGDFPFKIASASKSRTC